MALLDDIKQCCKEEQASADDFLFVFDDINCNIAIKYKCNLCSNVELNVIRTLEHFREHVRNKKHRKKLLARKLLQGTAPSDSKDVVIRSFSPYGIIIIREGMKRAVLCQFCTRRFDIDDDGLEGNLKKHVDSPAHKNLVAKKSKQSILPWDTSLKIESFENPKEASLCHGWHNLTPELRNLVRSGQRSDEEYLLVPIWKYELKVKGKNEPLLKTDGTIRSATCDIFTTSLYPFQNFCCDACKKLQVGSSKRTIERRAEASLAVIPEKHVNYAFYTPRQLKDKVVYDSWRISNH